MDYTNVCITAEQIKISEINHKKAVEIMDVPEGYVLHHKDKELRHTNIERYIEWNPEDLQIMTKSEHTKFHRKNDKTPRHTTPHTEETRKKISEKLTGKPHPHTENQDRKIGLANCKLIKCVETGEIFYGRNDVYRKTGIMCKNVIGKENRTAGNYHWIYLEKEI